MTPRDRDLDRLAERVSAERAATEARGETFYPGASRIHLAAFPPKERWDDWVELDSRAWPARVEKRSMLVPTTCFNCESACGLLAYVDPETLEIRKFEGNPEHPGSRGRNCAKGPATINQVTDPDRILQPLRRAGERGEGVAEFGDAGDVEDEVGLDEAQVEHGPERLAARDQLHGAGGLAEAVEERGQAGRALPGEGGGLHAACLARVESGWAASTASTIRWGVTGECSISTPSGPSASLTALAMAAGGAMAPPSPMPFWPKRV